MPETEPAVGSFRAELDRAAAWGVPAHVTVLYPFLPPHRIGLLELHRLSEAVRTVPRFQVTFQRVDWLVATRCGWRQNPILGAGCLVIPTAHPGACG